MNEHTGGLEPPLREVVVNGARYRVGDPVGGASSRVFRLVNAATGLALHVIRFPAADGTLPPPPADPNIIGPTGTPGFRLEPGPSPDNEDVTRYVALGENLLRAGHAPEAFRVFRHVTRLAPNDTEVLVRMGLALLYQEQPDAVGWFLDKAIRLEPNWLPYHRECVRFWWGVRGFGRAVIRFERLRRLFPHDCGLHRIGACLYLESGRPRDAAALMAEAPEAFEGDDLLARLQGDYAEVPPDVVARRLDGVIAPGTGGASLRELVRAQEKAFDEAMGHQEAARRAFDAQDLQTTEAHLQQAHDSLPADPFITWNLGLVKAHRGGAHPEARPEARRLVERAAWALPEGCATTHRLNHALLLGQMGALEEALEALAGLHEPLVELRASGDASLAASPGLCGWVDQHQVVTLGPVATLHALDAVLGLCRGRNLEISAPVVALREIFQGMAARKPEGDRESGLVTWRASRPGAEAASDAPDVPAATEPGAWAPGDFVLGAYRVLGRVSTTPHGPGYRLRCTVTGQDFVAIRARADDRPSRRALWNALAHMIDLPEHPCLVRYPFFHFVDDEVVVFLPLQASRSLAQLAKPDLGPTVGLERLLDIGIQVARGLEQAHAVGIVHGTLTWDAAFEDDDGNVRVGSFWNARSVEEARAIERCLAGVVDAGDGPLGALLADLLRGSLPVQRVPASAVPPPWASPELRRGDVLTRRTDVFGWGLVMAALILGRVSWEDPAEVPALIRAEASGFLPPVLLDLVAGALDPDPGGRWDDLGRAAERLAHLYAGIAGRPHEQCRPGIAEPRPPRRIHERAEGDPPWRALAHALEAAGLEPRISQPFATPWRASTRAHLLADLGILEQAVALLEGASSGPTGEPGVRGRIHGATASVLEQLGDLAGARRHYARCLELLDEHRDDEARPDVRVLTGLTLLEAAECHLGAGDARGAFDLAGQAAERMSEGDEETDVARWMVIRALCVQGIAGVQDEATREKGLRSVRRAAALAREDAPPEVQVSTLVELGRALRMVDRDEEALSALNRAEGILQALPQDRPQVRAALGQVALLRFPLLVSARRLDEAEEVARRGCRVFQELTLGGVDDPGLARQAAVAYGSLGAITAMRSGPAEAIPWHEQAREVLLKAALEFGGAGLALPMAQVCLEEGRAKAATGQSEPALACFARAVATLEAAPATRASAVLLGLYVEAIVAFSYVDGTPWNPAHSLDLLERAEGFRAELEARGEPVRALRGVRARIRYEQGRLFLATRGCLAAVEAFEQALDGLAVPSGTARVDVAPVDVALASRIHQDLAGALHRAGDLRRAVETSRRGLGLLEDLVRRADLGTGADEEIARILCLDSYRLAVLGDPEGALEACRRALWLLPDEPGVLPHRAGIQTSLGCLLLAAGRLADALAALREAEALTRRMVGPDPGPEGEKVVAFASTWVARAAALVGPDGGGQVDALLADALAAFFEEDKALESMGVLEEQPILDSAWEPVLREIVARHRGRGVMARLREWVRGRRAGSAKRATWLRHPDAVLALRLCLKGRAAMLFGLDTVARDSLGRALQVFESLDPEALREFHVPLYETAVALASMDLALFRDPGAARAILDRARALGGARELPKEFKKALARARSGLGIPS